MFDRHESSLAVELLTELYRLSRDNEAMEIFHSLRNDGVVSDEQCCKFGAWVVKRDAVVWRLKQMGLLADEKLPSSLLDGVPLEAFERFELEHEIALRKIGLFLQEKVSGRLANYDVEQFLVSEGWAKRFGRRVILNLCLLPDPSHFCEKMRQGAISWLDTR